MRPSRLEADMPGKGPPFCLHAGNPEHDFQQLAGRVQVGGTFAPIVESLSPRIEISSNVGIAIRLPAHTSHQGRSRPESG